VLPAALTIILVNGVIQGALAGINSVGFVLLWRTTKVVNLAQPSLGLVAGTIVGVLVVSGGWSFWWSAPIGIVLGAALAILAEKLVMVRLQDVPRSVLLIATIGLAQVFDAMRVGFAFAAGGELPTYQLNLGFTLDIHGKADTGATVVLTRLLSGHLLVLVALPLVAWGAHMFLTRSRLGVAAQALGQDIERARSLGIPSGLVRTAVWGIAGAIAAICGTLTIPVFGFGLGPQLNPTVLLLALAPAVFAGLRSIWGAAAAAIALGIAHQTAVYLVPGGLADLVLAVAILLAVAAQARGLVRGEAAARASAWEAAASTRPLPWSVASSGRIYGAGLSLLIIGLVAAVVPPFLMAHHLPFPLAGAMVSYGTATALALAAIGIGIAWQFAGELPLGHWGFAGIGAAIGAVTPGPWGFRAVVAGVAIGALNALAGLATRRRSSLAFAVVGLAAAAAAPFLLLRVGRGIIPADPQTITTAGGVLCVLAVLGAMKLRSTVFGARLVAARDDPERARWLGIDPLFARVIALAMSGFLVGVAGVVFVASQPSGIAENSFQIGRSLSILAMAVVGGISSPVGVLIGAIGLIGAERILPSPWDGLTSGIGVIAVVLFMPAGLARVVERIRDAGVRLLTRGESTPTPAVTATVQEVKA
jgi:ABC-type branched-subunit amino acid transport system permease subunit